MNNSVPQTLPNAFTDDDLMPFGKHKDVRMEDVPPNYLGWLWDNGMEFEVQAQNDKGRIARYIYNNRGALDVDATNAIKKLAIAGQALPATWPEGNIIVFDTETSGLPAYNAYDNPYHPQTPHICELGAAMFNANGELIKSMQRYVKPTNWEISPKTTEKNGLTNEFLHANGVPIEDVIVEFHMLAQDGHAFVCNDLLAFNVQFDMLLYRAECIRMKVHPMFRAFNHHCLMLLMKDVMKLPQKNNSSRSDFKYPTLEEVYRYFFNSMFDNAHGAIADLMATYKAFRAFHRK